MKSVLVIGGGVSGLALAFRLEQLVADVDVTVIEKTARPGGNAWTDHVNGFRVEAGPNGFLDSKPATLQLCRDLGLADQLTPASESAARNRYLFLDGKLRRLPGGFLDFLTSDLLSWRGKLSLLTERWRRSRPNGADESIAAFARRRTSREVAEVFADAFVTGIHGGDPELLSVRAAFPRLANLEREHGSVLAGLAATAKQRKAEAQARGIAYRRGGQMWSFRQGMRQLVETLQAKLRKPPLLGVGVRRIERQEHRWLVRGEGQDSWPADGVVLACPAYQQAAILQDLDRALADDVGGIAYNRIAVVALGYRQADVPATVDGFGYIAPQRSRRDLLGVQYCSSIFPERAPAGQVLMRALCGGWNRAEVAGWEDGRLVEAVRAELRLAHGIQAPPTFRHIVRWDRAIPQYRVGHVDRVARIMDRARQHPGLFLAGNAYHGVALNDCTEQAELLAKRVAGWLST